MHSALRLGRVRDGFDEEATYGNSDMSVPTLSLTHLS